ncbi:MAG: hypothetical protein H6707_19455, partial [Deltaproteobacteria bacterium]|nr:hypothetical protein [Deltaproteobacteria bacterium]
DAQTLRVYGAKGMCSAGNCSYTALDSACQQGCNAGKCQGTVVTPTPGTVAEEFSGPFSSWKNIRDFGAVGDGVADDTQALQAALDDARDMPSKTYSVLYLPAGTYRITKALRTTSRSGHTDYLGLYIVGEDPKTTTILWDGPDKVSSGYNAMFFLDAWFGKLSRITFDGGGRAVIGVFRAGSFSTYYEMSDLTFRDMNIGVVLGCGGSWCELGTTGQAEHMIKRSRFIRCSQAGIFTENFNSLDIWVMSCYFEKCGHGLFNWAGNFHALGNVFVEQTVGDIGLFNLNVFVVADNVSLRSKTFMDWTSGHSWGAHAVVHNNRIYDTASDHAIVTGAGSWLITDNVFRNRVGYDGPPIKLTARNQTLVGNRHHGSALFANAGAQRVSEVDTQSIARGDIPEPDLVLPETPAVQTRKVFEVHGGTGDDAAAIQAQIDAAAKEPSSSRPIVHLPRGSYLVRRAISLPANHELQLVGDGASSYGTTISLGAEAGSSTPLLRLLGPSRVTIRDLNLVAATATASQGAIVSIEGADQLGGRVYLEQVYANGRSANPEIEPAAAFVVDGVEQADVMLVGVGFSGQNQGIRVLGGPTRKAGQDAAGQVNVFGISTHAADRFFDVRDGGDLLAAGIWYEGASHGNPRIDLSDAGSISLVGYFLALAPTGAQPSIRLNGCRGALNILGSDISSIGGDAQTHWVSVQGDGSACALRVLETNLWGSGDLGFVLRDQSSPAAQTAWIHGTISSGGSQNDFPDAVTSGAGGKAQAIRDAVARWRKARLGGPYRTPAGTTSVQLYRVITQAGKGGSAVLVKR